MRPELGCFQGSSFPSKVHPKIHSPNLDKLASRSLLLKRAYVQQAACGPSRASLLTGRRPDTTHVYDLTSYFRKVGGNYTTIPQYFKDHGYISAGMGKIFHHTKDSKHDDPFSWTEPYFYAPNKNYYCNKTHSWRAISESEEKAYPLAGQQLAKHAIETLRKVAPKAKSGEQNFFIAVGFYKPHLPFTFPARFLDFYKANDIRLPDNVYAPKGMPSVAWNDYGELRSFHDIMALNASGDINTTLPDNVVLNLRRAYYAALSFTDHELGLVLEELESLGLADNTIVSFWGDHGWQLGEHGEWSKHTNFDLATHAPMMVRIPGQTDQGIVTEELTEFVDLFPTLVEAAGLPPLPLCPEDSTQTQLCREGASLVPLITKQRSRTTWKSRVFSQYPRSENNIKIMGYSMKTEQYRYTEWVQFNHSSYKPIWSNLFGAEIYDHKVDPDENFNILEEVSDQIRETLSDLLHQGWRGAMPSSSQHSIETLP